MWITRKNNNNYNGNTEYIILNYDAYKFLTALFIFHQTCSLEMFKIILDGSQEPDLVEDVLV